MCLLHARQSCYNSHKPSLNKYKARVNDPINLTAL